VPAPLTPLSSIRMSAPQSPSPRATASNESLHSLLSSPPQAAPTAGQPLPPPAGTPEEQASPPKQKRERPAKRKAVETSSVAPETKKAAGAARRGKAKPGMQQSAEASPSPDLLEDSAEERRGMVVGHSKGGATPAVAPLVVRTLMCSACFGYFDTLIFLGYKQDAGSSEGWS